MERKDVKKNYNKIEQINRKSAENKKAVLNILIDHKSQIINWDQINWDFSVR